MTIASYARYIYEYRRVVWQDYYNSSSSNRQTTSYLERTAAVSSFQQSNHMYLDLSSLFSPVCEYSYVCIGHETHESRSLQR